MALKAKDIAKMLDVSASTVSLVINNRPGVSDAKRREIIQRIKELDCGYLIKEQPQTVDNIGFVIYKRKGNIIDEAPFFSYYLESITATLRSMGYNMTVLYMSSNMSIEEQRQVLNNSDCKGFIVFAVEMIYEDMQVFKTSKLPFVMLDNSFQFNDVDTVAVNNMFGIYKATSYLYQRGHRRIGYLRSAVQINSFAERFSTYQTMLDKLGLPFREDDIVTLGYSDTEASADMRTYLATHADYPTAFVSDNDLLACGAIKGIKAAGLRVPEDISIIGFDDRPICLIIEPNLTTMMIPKDAFGTKSVELLIAKLQNKRNYNLKLEVGTMLIERQSVSIIPSDRPYGGGELDP
ncbi:MAG: LacI family DNA-binding transcriptional regulator [Eubacteriales bacterium]|nr:LacI family DNA-binding transcriptional regulator [Eubacteriales bacterium]